MDTGADSRPVAVLLLTRNGAAWLDEVLTAVRAQPTRHPIAIHAIDSRSTDGTVEILRRHGIRPTSIEPADFQHGRTRNLAAALAEPATEFLVFLTQDATPRPGWLDALVTAVGGDERVAGAFARQVPRPGGNPLLARRMLEDWPQVGGRERLVKRWSPNPGDAGAHVPHALAHFANTSSCIRRSVWARFPFPEVGFAEDVAWARQVLAAGYDLVYEPAAEVWHSHDGSLARTFRENVDHGAGVRSALASGDLMPPRRGAMERVWRDVRAIWSGDRSLVLRLRWTLYAPLWYGASVGGQWVGARAAFLPGGVRRHLSWQAALARGSRSPR
jgi:rhamnosyltransferase